MISSFAACCILPSYGARDTPYTCIVSGDMTQQFFVFLSLVTLTFDLFGRDFYTLYRTAKFDRPTFSRSEVIVWTNKQTDADENIHRAPPCYAGG